MAGARIWSVLVGVLRTAGLRLHGCFTWNAALARIYAKAWQLLMASLPEGWLKVHLRNNLIAANWPDGSLGVQELELCEGQRVRLKSRVGNLALRRAAFRHRLTHEPEVFDFLRKRSGSYDAVVEIGANIGVYTLLFGKHLVPQDKLPRVFSFEPSRKAYADLLEHLRLNGVANVVPFNCAIAPGPRLANFHENDRDLMKGTLDADIAPLFPGGSARKVTTLVAGAAEIRSLVQDFRRILLKVDVIGSEPAVIGELASFIEEKTPDIVVGVWCGNIEGLNASAALKGRYKLFRIDAGGLSARREFSVEAEAYCNYFLGPADGAATPRSSSG